MNQIDKFMAYLQELDQGYTRLNSLLSKKLNALDSYDIKALDGIIKEEQAYVLMAKGFEVHLEEHRKKLGVQGNTLAEVIEELPEDRREAFRVQHKRLSTTLDTVKTLNQRCQVVIEDRLGVLDNAMKQAKNTKGTTYRKEGGTAGPPAGNFFTKTV